MATYNDLKPGYYYLVKESEHASIELVYIAMETNKCVLVEYQDEDQSMNWFKKSDTLAELIEQLTDEQAMIFESIFEEEDEEALDWPEESGDDEWFGGDFEDDEDEEKRRALNN